MDDEEALRLLSGLLASAPDKNGHNAYLASDEFQANVAQLAAHCNSLLPKISSQFQPSSDGGTSSSAEGDQRQLPDWAASVAERISAGGTEAKAAVGTLSKLVDGLIRLGTRSALDEQRKSYATLNTCWKTVVSVLSHPTLSNASVNATQPCNSTAAGRGPLSPGAGEVAHILFALTSHALSSAVQSFEKQANTPGPEGVAGADPPSEGAVGLLQKQLHQQLMLVKFFQNNAIRLALLYPARTLDTCGPLLVSLVSCYFSLLRDRGQAPGNILVSTLSSSLGGNLLGLLTKLLAFNPEQDSRPACGLAEELCTFPSTSFDSCPGAESTPDARAVQSLLQLDKLATTSLANLCSSSDKAGDTQAGNEESSCLKQVPPEAWSDAREPGGQLLAIACSLEGSASFPEQVVGVLAGKFSLVLEVVGRPEACSSTVSCFLLPRQAGSQHASDGAKQAPSASLHFERLCFGMRCLVASVPTARLEQLGFQQLVLANALSRHPIVAEVALDTWQFLVRGSAEKVSVAQVNLCIELLERASEATLKLQGIVQSAGKASALQLGTGASKFTDIRDAPGSVFRQSSALLAASQALVQRLVTVTCALLKACSSSAFSEIVPSFFRRALGALKAGCADGVLAPVVALRDLLCGGLAQLLSERSPEDRSTLLQALLKWGEKFLADLTLAHSGDGAQPSGRFDPWKKMFVENTALELPPAQPKALGCLIEACAAMIKCNKSNRRPDCWAGVQRLVTQALHLIMEASSQRVSDELEVAGAQSSESVASGLLAPTLMLCSSVLRDTSAEDLQWHATMRQAFRTASESLDGREGAALSEGGNFLASLAELLSCCWTPLPDGLGSQVPPKWADDADRVCARLAAEHPEALRWALEQALMLSGQAGGFGPEGIASLRNHPFTSAFLNGLGRGVRCSEWDQLENVPPNSSAPKNDDWECWWRSFLEPCSSEGAGKGGLSTDWSQLLRDGKTLLEVANEARQAQQEPLVLQNNARNGQNDTPPHGHLQVGVLSVQNGKISLNRKGGGGDCNRHASREGAEGDFGRAMKRSRHADMDATVRSAGRGHTDVDCFAPHNGGRRESRETVVLEESSEPMGPDSEGAKGGGKDPVRSAMDKACSALQDALDGIQEMKGGSKGGPIDTAIVEKVHEADAVVRQLKSICRKAMA